MPANPEQATGSDHGATPKVAGLPELMTLPQDEDEAPPSDLPVGPNGDITKNTSQHTNPMDNSSMTVDS